MAKALGVPAADVKVDGLRAGSVVVDFSIKGEGGMGALAQLQTGDIAMPKFDAVCAALGINEVPVKGGLTMAKKRQTPPQPQLGAPTELEQSATLADTPADVEEAHTVEKRATSPSAPVEASVEVGEEEAADMSAQAPPKPCRRQQPLQPSYDAVAAAEEKRFFAAVVLQCFWRCMTAQMKMDEMAGVDDVIDDGAAIIIQAAFRRHCCRTRFDKMIVQPRRMSGMEPSEEDKLRFLESVLRRTT